MGMLTSGNSKGEGMGMNKQLKTDLIQDIPFFIKSSKGYLSMKQLLVEYMDTASEDDFEVIKILFTLVSENKICYDPINDVWMSISSDSQRMVEP